MKTRILPQSVLLLLSALSAGLMVGCGGDDAKSGDESNITEQPDDPFVRLVLGGGCSITDEAAGGKIKTDGSGGDCPATVTAVLDKLATTAKQDPSIFVVSETGDRPGADTPYRFVVAQPSEGNEPQELFLSMLGSGEGVSQTFIEVMAFDKKKGAYNYYHTKGSSWGFVGDGTMVEPGKPAAFECVNCHTTGAPNMKELQDSWANWNSTWFSPPDPMSADETFKRLFSKKQRADLLEPMIIKGDQAHVESYVDRQLKAGNVKGLLRHVMCDDGEPNLIASHSKNQQRFGEVKTGDSSLFPTSMLLTQLFKPSRTGTGTEKGYAELLGMTLPELANVKVSGTSYDKAINANGIQIGGEAGDAIFPYFTPQRGFVDNMVTESLVRREILNKDIGTDLLMTDFTVPSYSKIRCDLADTAPTEGTTAEDIRTAWIKNLDGSNLVGASELKARLEDANDLEGHTKTVNDYLAACNARGKTDADGFAADVVKVLSQRRKEFKDAHAAIVESEFLLPTDNLKDAEPHTWRFSATSCILEAQPTKGSDTSSSNGAGGSGAGGGGAGGSGAGGGTGGCAHSECSAGAALAADCSPCATKICGDDSFCCTNSWDDACVKSAGAAAECSCN